MHRMKRRLMIISLMMKNMCNKFLLFGTFTPYNDLIAFINIAHHSSIIVIWILCLQDFFK